MGCLNMKMFLLSRKILIQQFNICNSLWELFMKVIQLFGSLNHGGAEILTLDVCKQFPDEIGEQILVTYRCGSLEDAFNEHNIPFNKISKGFMAFHLLRQLRKLISQYDL